MPSRSRRSILGSGAAIVALFAGCTGPARSPRETTERSTTTPDSSPTETTRESPTTTPAFDAGMLSASASLLATATNEHPPRIELTLTNDGERAVPITPKGTGGGLPLERLHPFESGTARLVAFPTDPEHVFIHGADIPSEPANDCWHFPDGKSIAVENLGFAVTLDSGETYSIDHHLYYDDPEEACVPAETYRTTTKVKLADTMDSGPVLSLSYDLTVEDGAVGSVTVDATPET